MERKRWRKESGVLNVGDPTDLLQNMAEESNFQSPDRSTMTSNVASRTPNETQQAEQKGKKAKWLV